MFETDTAEHSTLSHCIIRVVIKPQLQGCMGTRQFSLMKYRLAAVEVKQVDIHLEVAMRIYHKATKEARGKKTMELNFNLANTIKILIYSMLLSLKLKLIAYLLP